MADAEIEQNLDQLSIVLDSKDQRMLKKLIQDIAERHKISFLNDFNRLTCEYLAAAGVTNPADLEEQASTLIRFLNILHTKRCQAIGVDPDETLLSESTQAYFNSPANETKLSFDALSKVYEQDFTEDEMEICLTALSTVNGTTASGSNNLLALIKSKYAKGRELDRYVQGILAKLKTYRDPEGQELEVTGSPSTNAFNGFMDTLSEASRLYADPVFSAFEDGSVDVIVGDIPENEFFLTAYAKRVIAYLTSLFNVEYLNRLYFQRKIKKLESDIASSANTLMLRNLTKIKNKLTGEDMESGIFKKVKMGFAIFFSFFILSGGLFEILDGVATVLGMLSLNPVVFGITLAVLAAVGMVAFISFELVQFFQELGINPNFNLHETIRYKKIKKINDVMLEILKIVDGSSVASVDSNVNMPLAELARVLKVNSRLNLFVAMNKHLGECGHNKEEHEAADLENIGVFRPELKKYFYIKPQYAIGKIYLDEIQDDQISISIDEEGAFTCFYKGKKVDVIFDVEKFKTTHPKSPIRRTILSEKGVDILSGVLTAIVSLIEGSSGFFLGFGLLTALGVSTGPFAPIVLGIIGGIGLAVMGIVINYYAIKRLLQNFSKDKVEVVCDLEKQHKDINEIEGKFKILADSSIRNAVGSSRSSMGELAGSKAPEQPTKVKLPSEEGPKELSKLGSDESLAPSVSRSTSSLRMFNTPLSFDDPTKTGKATEYDISGILFSSLGRGKPSSSKVVKLSSKDMSVAKEERSDATQDLDGKSALLSSSIFATSTAETSSMTLSSHLTSVGHRANTTSSG